VGLFDKHLIPDSLEELNNKWKDCRKCPLKIGNNLVCSSLGNENAKVIVVGQSPTVNEAKTGVIMQDKGGRDIRKWFSDIAPSWNIHPDEILYTNITHCPSIVRTNPNKEISFIDEEGNLKEPVIPANQCRPYLLAEINIVKPKLIITIGKNSLQSFAKSDPEKKIPVGIDKARKRIWSYMGYRFAAVGMPTRLGEPDPNLAEDEDFLRNIFNMKSHVYKPRPQRLIIDSIKDNFIKVDACKSCDLHKTASCKVFGTGNTKADIVLVGEAPGQQEDNKGVPFIGPAGQVLRKYLKEVNIDHKSIYITNTVKCWPGPGNPTPEPEHVNQCFNHLQTIIKNINPKIIVALGAVALQALTGLPRRVGIVQGKPQTCRFSDAPVIPTWHPSYVMRELDKRGNNSVILKQFIRDLKLAKTLSTKKGT